ncbi:MAG: hypothetical protein JXB10_05960 [Pirellulales bacterium]|nr:hypothetical protein [Pirellulales bacterium]
MNKIPRLNRRWSLLPACLALGLMPFAGCSDGRPKRVPVSGRVLIDGRPLEAGFIRMVPRGNRPAEGELDADGRFVLGTFEENDGCVPGKHRVQVVANKNISPTALKWYAPKKYMSTATSGLEIEVVGPRDDVEIHLTWKGSNHDRPFVEHTQAE